MAIIQGTPGNDSYLPGTLEDDQMYGLAGDDFLYGDDGNDLLNGDEGRDALAGGDGNDTLDGDNGNDSLDGGFDNDDLYGRAGNDDLSGSEGNDRLYGGDGNDEFDGGGGDDRLYGGNGNDYLYGLTGNDTIEGNRGNDTLTGWIGDDLLIGGDGNDLLNDAFEHPGYGVGENQIDTLIGGAGRDTFSISYLVDSDRLTIGINDYLLIKDFNPQQDFIQLRGSKSNYYLGTSPAGLPTGTAIFFDQPGSGSDELIAIVEEDFGLNLNASYFTITVDDFFEGSQRDDQFDSGRGNDTLLGTGGNDSFTAGSGNDVLVGGTGNDSLSGGSGNDILVGTSSSFYGESSSSGTPGSEEIDLLVGGTGADQFILGEVFEHPYFTNTYIFYDDTNTTAAGTNDYALIQDFNSSQDIIQLLGTQADYRLRSTSGSLPAGTGIYVDKPNSEPDELIAILQGVSPSSLSLSASYFSYVNVSE